MTSTPLPKSKKPLHEKVAATLSSEILARLQPGARLDSEAALARKYRVSVLTLRQSLSVLAHAGMIERRHGSGTYVTDHRCRTGVAVGTVSRDGQTANSFQTRLFLLLSELFRREGYRCRAYVAPFGFVEGWAELAEDVEYGRIAGAAFVAMNPESIEIPFEARGVPVVGGPGKGACAGLDYADMARRGVRHLVEQGCRRIALMQWDASGPPMTTAYDAFRAALRECGLPLRTQWVRQHAVSETPGAGWRDFNEIWSTRVRGEKPDGLLVTDDVLMRDAAMAILANRVDVGRELKIVTHANKGSGLSYPFPVSSLEVDIDEWAEAMVQALIARMNPTTRRVPRTRRLIARLITAEETQSLGQVVSEPARTRAHVSNSKIVTS